MQQDSLLVDVEDIIKRIHEFEARFKAEQAAVEAKRSPEKDTAARAGRQGLVLVRPLDHGDGGQGGLESEADVGEHVEQGGQQAVRSVSEQVAAAVE